MTSLQNVIISSWEYEHTVVLFLLKPHEHTYIYILYKFLH